MAGKAGRAVFAALVGLGAATVLLPGDALRLGAITAMRAAADGADAWLEDQPIHGRAEASDGDTLRVGGVKVRLFGVDAPEAAQLCGAWACGLAAAARLGALVADGPVTCTPRDRDRYGRVVATCTVAGHDLGAQLVAEGLARAYTRYGDDYVGAEARARTERIGLWRGEAEAPWDYRAEKAAEKAAGRAVGRTGARDPRLAPMASGGQADEGGGCRIKGNVSAGGKRIYHLPEGRGYARTRIDPSRGEAWFCDEAAARAAGFRPPGG